MFFYNNYCFFIFYSYAIFFSRRGDNEIVEQNGQKTKSGLIPEYFSTTYSVHINAFIKAES